MQHTDPETPDRKRCKNCKCRRPLVEVPLDRLPDWIDENADVQIVFPFPFYYEREETRPVK